MAYGTALELRARINKTDVADDATLTALIAAAERNVNRACNRPDGFVASGVASIRYYPGSGMPYQFIDECVSVNAVAVKDSPSDDEGSYTAWVVGTVGTTTGADVFPATGDPEYPEFGTTPYTLLVVGANGDYATFTSGAFTSRGGWPPSSSIHRGLPTVKVTADWGFASIVPADIKECTIMQASRWYKRLQSSMADVLASGELGTLLYRQSLDPDIRRLLVDGRYVKPVVGRR